MLDLQNGPMSHEIEEINVNELCDNLDIACQSNAVQYDDKSYFSLK